MYETARKLLATTLIAVMLLPFRPVPARAQTEAVEATDAFTAPDGSHSLTSVALNSTAKNPKKAPDIPVGPSGAYQRTFSIQVPPARGFEPSLALRYDSGSAKRSSPYGAGWSLTGQAITRSQIQGTPPLVHGPSGLVYANTLETGASFELNGMPLVPIEGTPAIGLPTPILASSLFLALRRTSDMTVVEWSSQENAFVVHRPDGSKGFFGYDPFDGRRARVNNELGDFAWHILREQDTDSNTITYDYRAMASQDRANKKSPQPAPLLEWVRYGGNTQAPIASMFQVRFAYTTSGGRSEPDFDAGAGLVQPVPATLTSVFVCAPAQSIPTVQGTTTLNARPTGTLCPAGQSEVRRYTATTTQSPDSKRWLLTKIVEARAGLTELRETIFRYTTNNGTVKFAEPTPLVVTEDHDLRLLLTREGIDGLSEESGYVTEALARAPATTSVAGRLIDVTRDGLADVIYSPGGINSPEAPLVTSATPLVSRPSSSQGGNALIPYLGTDLPRSGYSTTVASTGSLALNPFETTVGYGTVYDQGGLMSFEELATTTSGVGFRADDFPYSDFADITGDGHPDAIFSSVREAEISFIAPGLHHRQCFSEAFWQQCGVIDPIGEPDVCQLTSVCDDTSHVDLSLCSLGFCWITEADFTFVFQNDGDWDSTPPFSPAGLQLVVGLGAQADIETQLIRVAHAEIRARLDLEEADKEPVFQAFSGAPGSGNGLIEGCAIAMETCTGALYDGAPRDPIGTQVDRTLCEISPDLDPLLCSSGNVQRLPAILRLGVHEGGATPEGSIPLIPLYGWPSDVARSVFVGGLPGPDGTQIAPFRARTVEDFTAPFVDLNGDGKADISLMRRMRVTAAENRPMFEFTPHAWINKSNDVGIAFHTDWAPVAVDEPRLKNYVSTSEFSQSLNDILVRPGATYRQRVDLGDSEADFHDEMDQRRYAFGAAYTATYLDFNADGLPDLLAAKPDHHQAAGSLRQRTSITTTGHEVFLNRGYRFGVPESDPTKVPLAEARYGQGPFGVSPDVMNEAAPTGHVLKMELARIGLEPVQAFARGTAAPLSATALTDINGDGRTDVILWYGSYYFDGSTQVSQDYRQEVWLNRPSGFVQVQKLDETNVNSPSATRVLELPTSLDPRLLRLADVSAPDETGTLLSARAFQAGDLMRLDDVDGDGLVDIVVPGTVCPLPSSVVDAYFAERCELRVAVPLGTGMISHPTRPIRYVPAMVMRNTSNPVDLLEEVEESGGSSVVVTYEAARRSLSVHSAEVPAGMLVTTQITSSARDDGPSSTVALSYRDFHRISAVETLGFSEVSAVFTSRRFENQVEVTAGSESVTRVYNTSEDHDYALRGLMNTLVHEGAGTQVTTAFEYVVTPVATNWYRIDNNVTVTSESCVTPECFGDAATTVSTVESRDNAGSATEVTSGDLDGSSIVDPVVVESTYDNRVAEWELGLTTSVRTEARIVDVSGASSVQTASYETRTYDADGRLATIMNHDIAPSWCADVGPRSSLIQVIKYSTAGLPTIVLTDGLLVETAYDSLQLSPRTTETTFVGYIDGEPDAPVILTGTRYVDIRSGATWSTVDPNNALTTTIHDVDGRPTQVWNAWGVKLKETVYKDRAPRTETQKVFQEPNIGATTVDHLDGNGGVYKRTTHQFSGSTISDEVVMYHALDSRGLSWRSTVPSWIGTPAGDAPAVEFVYDDLGREILTVSPGPTGDRVSSAEYGVRVEARTDPNGLLTVRKFDRHGEIVEVQRNGGIESASIAYHRDGLGRLASVVDADGFVSNFEVDRASRVVRYTLPHAQASSPSGNVETCYSPQGNVLRKVDQEGKSLLLTYDSAARPVQKTVFSALNAEKTYLNYDVASLNAMGRLAVTKDDERTITVVYDARGFAKEVQHAFLETQGVVDEVAYDYDVNDQGRITGIRTFTDSAGTIQQLGDLTIKLDGRGRAIEVNDGITELAADPVFDATGRLEELSLGVPNAGAPAERARGAWRYDPETQDLLEISFSRQSRDLNRLILDDHDGLGVPTHETRDGTLNTSGTGIEIEKVWKFDGLHRLSTQKVVKNGLNILTEDFTYSSGGRLLKVVGADTEFYNYDNASLPGAVTRIIGGKNDRDLTYDASGHLLTDSELGRTVVDVDANGCALEMVGSGGRSFTQHCTADGKSSSRKAIVGATTRTVVALPTGELRVEENQLVHRLPVNGNMAMELVYSTKTAKQNTTESIIIMSDGRGSVLATAPLLTPGPSTFQALDYDAWGKPIALGAPPPRHTFIDHEPEVAFGTFTFGRRIYDPTVRRWLSADPLISAVPAADTGKDQHDLWGYAASDPVSRVDPGGLVAPVVVAGVLVGLALGSANCDNVNLAAPAAGAVAGAVVAQLPAILASPTTTEVVVGVLEGEAGLGTGLLAAGGAKAADAAVDVAKKGVDEAIEGFRAVSKAEADDIVANGFRAHPEGRSMDDKWFSESLEGATEFLEKMPGFDAIVKAIVPRSVYDRAHKVANIDQRGPGFAVREADLPQVKSAGEVEKKKKD